jgi:hypothetical protein
LLNVKECEMSLTKKDFEIFDRFEFDRAPVGVKYTFKRPERIDRLGEKMTLCEMLKRAQEGNTFYAELAGGVGRFLTDDAERRFCRCAEGLRRASLREQTVSADPDNTGGFD